MNQIKAAIVTEFGKPPIYTDIDTPKPANTNEMLIDVIAVGLHHVTKGLASGAHYASNTTPPFIAGMDGVGRDSHGKLRYFVQGPGQPGSMAQKTVVEANHSIKLPNHCDQILMAGAMNPAMASWFALRCRVPYFHKKKRILILGATGSSGRMAVQISRYIGASQIIAVGRDTNRLAKLPALGATDIITLDDERLGQVTANVDVVLDFIWGESSVKVIEALLKNRSNRSQSLCWVHVGGMAGEVAPIPGSFLRSTKLQIIGSGHGSVSGFQIMRELPKLINAVSKGKFHIDIKPVALREVESVWNTSSTENSRIVFTL